MPSVINIWYVNFFIKTAGKYNIYQVEKGDAISILKDSFPGKFPSIKITPITEGEIKIQYITYNQKQNHHVMMK